MTITTTYFIIILMMLMALVYTIYIKNAVNPVFLFTVPTGLAYVLYFWYFQPTWILSNEFNLVFLIGEFSFIFGYYFYSFISVYTSSISSSKKTLYQNIRFEKNIIVWLFLIIGTIMDIMSIIKLKQLGAGSSGFRDQFIDIVSSLPAYVIYGKYLTVFGLSALLYSLLVNKLSKWYLMIIIFVTSIAYYSANLTQARTDILIVLMPLLITFLMVKMQKVNWRLFLKYIAWSMICVFLLYFSFLFVQIERFGSTTDNFLSSENQTFQYIGLPLAAFDKWMVMPGFGGVRHGFGLIEPVDKFLKLFQINQYEYSFASRGQFNVYSYLSAPFLAFGKIGVLVTMFIAGYFNNWLFSKARYDAYYMLYYAFFEVSVMLSFYSWQMTSMVNIYALMFIILIQFHRVAADENKFNY